VYALVDTGTGQSAGRWAVITDAAGERSSFTALSLEPRAQWRSTRTFQDYPTEWVLEIPEAKLSVKIEAAFADQEFVTVLSKPAFLGRPVPRFGHARGASDQRSRVRRAQRFLRRRHPRRVLQAGE